MSSPLSTYNRLALTFFFFSPLIYFFSYTEVDPDLWGHLFFGREIVRSGALPPSNGYSYTSPEHVWINHEWFSEVVFYVIFNFFGSPGLILLKVIFGSALVWILDLSLRRRVSSPAVRTLTLVWIMAILSPGFNVRPQLFTYLFFGLLLFLFYRYENGKKLSLLWIPLIMLLWVNLHGGFVAGLGALAVFSLWAVTRALKEDPIKTIAASVMAPLGLSVIFLILNPYGLDLLSFLAADLLIDRPITEWQPVPLWDLSLLEFKLAALLVLFVIFRRGLFSHWEIPLATLSAFFAIRYQRHTPLFAIAAAPLLAEALQKAASLVQRQVREWMLACLFFALSLYPAYSIGKVHLEHRLRLIVNPLEYPTQVADFIKRNGIQGNMAVPFDWGEYLIWKLYPEVRVSIDGRYTTAYPKSVIEDHWEWMSGGQGWRRLAERYATDLAVTKRSHPVTALMRKDPEWVYIYSDPVAFLFVRKTREDILARLREKRLAPPRSASFYFPA